MQSAWIATLIMYLKIHHKIVFPVTSRMIIIKVVSANHALCATAPASGIHPPLIIICPNSRLPGGIPAFLVKDVIRQRVSRGRQLPALAVMANQRTMPECSAVTALSAITPITGTHATPGLILAYPTMMAAAASGTVGKAAVHVTRRHSQKRPAQNATIAMTVAMTMIKTAGNEWPKNRSFLLRADAYLTTHTLRSIRKTISMAQVKGSICECANLYFAPLFK